MKFTPTAFSSFAVIWARISAFSTSPVAAVAMAPGTLQPSPGSLVTLPPSWSMVMKASCPVSLRTSSWISAHRAFTCSMLFKLRWNRMMFPILYSFTRRLNSGSSSVPGNPITSRCPICSLKSMSLLLLRCRKGQAISYQNLFRPHIPRNLSPHILFIVFSLILLHSAIMPQRAGHSITILSRLSPARQSRPPAGT